MEEIAPISPEGPHVMQQQAQRKKQEVQRMQVKPLPVAVNGPEEWAEEEYRISVGRWAVAENGNGQQDDRRDTRNRFEPAISHSLAGILPRNGPGSKSSGGRRRQDLGLARVP